jgi:hypothetical protein
LAGSSEGKTVSVTAITGPAITNSGIIRSGRSYDSSAHPSIGKGSAAQDFKGLAH